MNSIKKHYCPSCGGNLIVDNDKQLYYCASCGSTYDYEYFREEEMHNMADTYLSRREFMAAVDAYRFILRKDPHDFHALRGLMLASAYMDKMDDLLRGEKTKAFSYNSDMVKEVIESASDKDRAYFEEFGNIYSDKKKLYDMINELETLRKDRRMADDSIKLKSMAGDVNEALGIMIISGLLLVGAIFMGIVMTVMMESICGFGMTFLSWGFISFILFISSYKNYKKAKRINASTAGLYNDLNNLGDKIKELEEKTDILAADIRKASIDFVEKDKLKVK